MTYPEETCLRAVTHRQKRPMVVPEKAKQVGDIRARWRWVESSVWPVCVRTRTGRTERMLATLETGVKGGVWFSLIDKGPGGNNALPWIN